MQELDAVNCDGREPLACVVTLGNGWRLFTHPIAGHHMMGTVQHGTQLGGLAKSPDGRWVQVNEGLITALPQQTVALAMQAARAQLRAWRVDHPA